LLHEVIRIFADMVDEDNIVALASAPGTGAIALLRVSGKDAITIVDSLFVSKVGVKKLVNQKSHTLHLGNIVDKERVLDEVLVSIFKGPNSYTGENVVEISCHGSPYIQEQILQLLLRNRCRNAKAGEFTLRAFLNGKMDLSQAEAVADLIASDSAAAHEVAMNQMRGGFSSEIEKLRGELLEFASLIELELDFSQEDVEFANREQFENLLNRITTVLKHLIDSFATGNVLKNGVPVAIVGAPNVGKSTLLNALLNEERAIVSDIAGTTRDTVEDQININGISFRFIDTAGIRETEDTIERIGIEKTFDKMEKAKIVLYLFEANGFSIAEWHDLNQKYPDKTLVAVCNKSENLEDSEKVVLQKDIPDVVFISAKTKAGVSTIEKKLSELISLGVLQGDNSIVSNSRHYDALLKALEEIQKVKEGMEMEVASDLLAIDIRQALFHLGEITGSVTTDDLLGNIFSNFCIGK